MRIRSAGLTATTHVWDDFGGGIDRALTPWHSYRLSNHVLFCLLLIQPRVVHLNSITVEVYLGVLLGHNLDVLSLSHRLLKLFQSQSKLLGTSPLLRQLAHLTINSLLTLHMVILLNHIHYRQLLLPSPVHYHANNRCDNK